MQSEHKHLDIACNSRVKGVNDLFHQEHPTRSNMMEGEHFGKEYFT